MRVNIRKIVFSLILLSFIGYSIYVYTAGTENPLGDMSDTKTLEGRNVWMKYNCGACHQIFGLGGLMGPDLTNIASSQTDDFIYAKIKWGDRKMPNLELKEVEIQNLITFLNFVDKTGTANPNITIGKLPWYNYANSTDRNTW